MIPRHYGTLAHMEIIEDSGSFTRFILKNKFQTDAQLQEIMDVLDDQYRTRKSAADGDNRTDTNRDQYMFFQGAMMGMLIAFKQTKNHYENTAWEQGVDPQTGEKLSSHGNA